MHREGNTREEKTDRYNCFEQTTVVALDLQIVDQTV
jgi:hypothetical protein